MDAESTEAGNDTKLSDTLMPNGPAVKSRRTAVSISPGHSTDRSQDSHDDVNMDSREPKQYTPRLDIANFPSTELLRMLAALLQHIATSNDQIRPQHQQMMVERAQVAQEPSSTPPSMYMSLTDPNRPSTTTAALSALTSPSSMLCFHARHVPNISIEAYLLRILKYCPTTNDVFLSLLVYFDRLSRVGATGSFPGDPTPPHATAPTAPDGSPSGMMPWSSQPSASTEQQVPAQPPFPGISGFVIDSYNIHRLIIAGVTVASKFFSDVFYTNARYAKVGGLAVHELNQLELHFLLLTDFRLMVHVAEIQQYGDQLLAYAHDMHASTHVARPLAPADNDGAREATAVET